VRSFTLRRGSRPFAALASRAARLHLRRESGGDDDASRGGAGVRAGVGGVRGWRAVGRGRPGRRWAARRDGAGTVRPAGDGRRHARATPCAAAGDPEGAALRRRLDVLRRRAGSARRGLRRLARRGRERLRRGRRRRVREAPRRGRHARRGRLRALRRGERRHHQELLPGARSLGQDEPGRARPLQAPGSARAAGDVPGHLGGGRRAGEGRHRLRGVRHRRRLRGRLGDRLERPRRPAARPRGAEDVADAPRARRVAPRASSAGRSRVRARRAAASRASTS
jgi:hypothetical protein